MNRLISLVTILASVGCDSYEDRDVSEAEGSAARAAPEAAPSRPYRHPLRNVERLPDGRLPFVDTNRSPDGRAYAIGEAVAQPKEEAEARTLYSGVLELDVRPMTETERRSKPRREHTDAPIDKLDPGLRALVDAGEATGPMSIKIHLRDRPEGTLTQRLNRAIAEGRIRTVEDREVVREEEMAALADTLRPSIDALAARVEALGGEVTYRCVYQPCVSARLGLGQVRALEQVEAIQRIGVIDASTPDSLDGQEKAETLQTRTFWDESFEDLGVSYELDGNNGQESDIRMAVLDDEGFRTSHVAFKEDSGGSRIDGLWDCRTPPCVAVGSFAGISDHGTAVLGAAMADYRDGQSAAVATTDAREQRSASGGEAKAYLYWASRQVGDQQAVYDEIVNRSPAPHLLVSSNSIGTPTDCSGEDTEAVGADGVYESGIAYFKSVNNDGLTGSSANCNVGQPAEAIGVFAVAGFDDPEASTDICDLKDSPIDANSSWGGSTSDFAEGKFRSIVALTGPYSGANVPWFTSDTALGTFVGTSHSTPVVASAAVNVIDMMKNVRSTDFIDDPGVLYAWMLNMGDRRSQTGAMMTSGFDHRTGAGNLKARFVGNAGLDAPWYFHHFTTCISDGEVYTYNLGTFPSDVESLRAVAWWYDRRLETSTVIDDIDLTLQTTSGTDLRVSNDSYDNKERVFVDEVGTLPLELQITGFDVTSDGEGCGANSMPVFVTVLVEDDDRDDADGPTYDPVTCEGVDPL